MSEHFSSIDIAAPAQHVFDFLCQQENMRYYVPALELEAEALGTTTAAAPYFASGTVDMDPAQRRLSWTLEGELSQAGTLHVSGDMVECRVIVNVVIEESVTPRTAAALQLSLEQGLEALRLRWGVRRSDGGPDLGYLS